MTENGDTSNDLDLISNIAFSSKNQSADGIERIAEYNVVKSLQCIHHSLIRVCILFGPDRTNDLDPMLDHTISLDLIYPDNVCVDLLEIRTDHVPRNAGHDALYTIAI